MAHSRGSRRSRGCACDLPAAHACAASPVVLPACGCAGAMQYITKPTCRTPIMAKVRDVTDPLLQLPFFGSIYLVDHCVHPSIAPSQTPQRKPDNIDPGWRIRGALVAHEDVRAICPRPTRVLLHPLSFLLAAVPARCNISPNPPVARPSWQKCGTFLVLLEQLLLLICLYLTTDP